MEMEIIQYGKVKFGVEFLRQKKKLFEKELRGISDQNHGKKLCAATYIVSMYKCMSKRGVFTGKIMKLKLQGLTLRAYIKTDVLEKRLNQPFVYRK